MIFSDGFGHVVGDTFTFPNFHQEKNISEFVEFKMTNVLPNGHLQKIYSCKICSYSSTIENIKKHLTKKHFKYDNPTHFLNMEDTSLGGGPKPGRGLFQAGASSGESLTCVDQFLEFHDRIVTKSGKIHKSYKCTICGHIARSDNIKQHVKNKHLKSHNSGSIYDKK